MKEIQCPTCRGPVIVKRRDQRGRPFELPLRIGVFSSGQHPMIIKCGRCANSFKMQAAEFAAMPEVVE